MDSALTSNRKHRGKHPYQRKWKCQIKILKKRHDEKMTHQVHHNIWDKCCLSVGGSRQIDVGSHSCHANPAAPVHLETTELTSVNRVEVGHISWQDQTQEQTCLGAQKFLKGRARDWDSIHLYLTSVQQWNRYQGTAHSSGEQQLSSLCNRAIWWVLRTFCFIFVAILKEHTTNLDTWNLLIVSNTKQPVKQFYHFFSCFGESFVKCKD